MPIEVGINVSLISLYTWNGTFDVEVVTAAVSQGVVMIRSRKRGRCLASPSRPIKVISWILFPSAYGLLKVAFTADKFVCIVQAVLTEVTYMCVVNTLGNSAGELVLLA